MKRALTFAIILLVMGNSPVFGRDAVPAGPCGSGAAAHQASASTVTGCNVADCITVGGLGIECGSNRLFIGFEFGLKGLNVRSNRAALLTPHLICRSASPADSVSQADSRVRWTADLPSVGIYGRQRYYSALRSRSLTSGNCLLDSRKPDILPYMTAVRFSPQPTEAGAESGRAGRCGAMAAGRRGSARRDAGEDLIVDRPAPGDTLELRVRVGEYGCCDMLLGECDILVGKWAQPAEGIAAQDRPTGEDGTAPGEAQEKTAGGVAGGGRTPTVRSLHGTARISFRPDRTDIDPTYRDNAGELAKITAVLDSLGAVAGTVSPKEAAAGTGSTQAAAGVGAPKGAAVTDSTQAAAGTGSAQAAAGTGSTQAAAGTGSTQAGGGVSIVKVALRGYASPESPYAHNAALAAAREEALKRFVMERYGFAEDVVGTSFEPEDWDGLRELVAGSDLRHREEILALIDGPDTDPDAMEWKIKSRYPEDYRRILADFYPALRRVDYEIFYTVTEED